MTVSIGTLTKMFCKNRSNKTNNSNQSQKQSKKKKTSNKNHEKKKDKSGVEFVCLRREISTKVNMNKKSLTLCLRQLSLTVPRFSNKGNQ